MIQLKSRIDLEHTIQSGQVFLWQRQDDTWYGINGTDIIMARQKPFQIRHMDDEDDFFRETDNYERILAEIAKDDIMRKAIQRFFGLRLLRQDPFQCTISFIASSNSSIPKIRSSLQRLCNAFGKECVFGGERFHLFPTPERLAKATTAELLHCGLGYRAAFVKDAAERVTEGRLDLDELKKRDYEYSRDALLKVKGVGMKVADCILLFSLEKLEAFPLDRWITRALSEHYPEFGIKKDLTPNRYQTLREKVTKYFGRNAGYAQQFLFMMQRGL